MSLFSKPIKRRVFFSFHYKKDYWRAQMIRNMGVVEKNQIVKANKWESIKQNGDKAIKAWIDKNLKGTSCLVVLVGEETSNRDFVLYEIEQAWNNKKGVLGIRINNLKDNNQTQSKKGENPFKKLFFVDSEKPLAKVVKLKVPRLKSSKGVYNCIFKNLEEWVEEAIKIRQSY